MRLRAPLALAMIGGCGLLGAMFLDWYSGVNAEGAYFNRSSGAPAYAGVFSAWGDGESAWEAFSVLDIALAAFGALAMAVGVAGLRGLRPSRLRVARYAVIFTGVGTAAWVLLRGFDLPELTGFGPGALLGFAAIVVATLGAWLSVTERERRDSNPRPPA